jgi:hypothetical protein
MPESGIKNFAIDVRRLADSYNSPLKHTGITSYSDKLYNYLLAQTKFDIEPVIYINLETFQPFKLEILKKR